MQSSHFSFLFNREVGPIPLWTLVLRDINTDRTSSCQSVFLFALARHYLRALFVSATLTGTVSRSNNSTIRVNSNCNGRHIPSQILSLPIETFRIKLLTIFNKKFKYGWNIFNCHQIYGKIFNKISSLGIHISDCFIHFFGTSVN
jgi:hypothetical protein